MVRILHLNRAITPLVLGYRWLTGTRAPGNHYRKAVGRSSVLIHTRLVNRETAEKIHVWGYCAFSEGGINLKVKEDLDDRQQLIAERQLEVWFLDSADENNRSWIHEVSVAQLNDRVRELIDETHQSWRQDVSSDEEKPYLPTVEIPSDHL